MWLVTPVVALVLAQDPPNRPPPRLDYRMECVLDDGVQDRLQVELRVTGLDPDVRDLAFQLPRWGEWIDVDEYYVTRVSGDPPVKHDLVNRFYWRPELPADWDGSLTMRYSIPIVAFGSAVQQLGGLLPWRTPTYVHCFSINTLMRMLVVDRLEDADRHLELVAPAGMSVATGWAGVTEGRQSIALAPDAENTVIFFGKPVATARDGGSEGEPRETAIEVVQFGAHADHTAVELDLARKVRAAFAASTGATPSGVERIFVTEPGLGGTHVEGAITHGHPELENGRRFEIGTAHFLAHEMFHAWLPGVLEPQKGPGITEDGDGLEWFFEGFTDYLSLWHLASTGLVTEQEFADRLRFLQSLLRESPACGRVAFADPNVNWREPDAEQVAYKGGCLLAFHLDVAVRDQGEPGLSQLFRDHALEHASKYSLSSLRHWIEANAGESFWNEIVATGRLPDVEDSLLKIGYRERREGDSRILEAAGADFGTFFRFEAPAR